MTIRYYLLFFVLHTKNIHSKCVCRYLRNTVNRILSTNLTLFLFLLLLLLPLLFPVKVNIKAHTIFPLCFNYRLYQKMKSYQGNLNVSFHHPCFEQLATILSSRIIISENVGLIAASGCQHFSINLQSK